MKTVLLCGGKGMRLREYTEKIPEFIKKCEYGAEVVVGIRRMNKGEGS